MDHRYFCRQICRFFLCSVILLFSCDRSQSNSFSSLGIENSKIKMQGGLLRFLRKDEGEGKIFLYDQPWSYQIIEGEKVTNSFENAKVRLRYYIKGLYQNSEPPYPGAVSSKEQCPRNFLPNFFPARSTEELELFAVSGRGTDRNVLGACDEHSAKSTILKIVLLCRKTQRVHELDIWGPYPNVPNTDFIEILNSFSCKN